MTEMQRRIALVVTMRASLAKAIDATGRAHSALQLIDNELAWALNSAMKPKPKRKARK